MDSITLENYRCFGERQTVRLAPLTLLVGENSTGKTSFLALIRALWDVIIAETIPNFREAPYDLGSFRGIVHEPGRAHKKASTFAAGFTDRHASYAVTFGEWATIPYPVKRGVSLRNISFELSTENTQDINALLGIRAHEFQYRLQERWARRESRLTSLRFAIMDAVSDANGTGRHSETLRLLLNEADIDPTELEPLEREVIRLLPRDGVAGRPFAGAPVRSKPSRIYEPENPTRDAEGEYVPSYLADLAIRNKAIWVQLKEGLERFGKDSGLFDEIEIKSFGTQEDEPFQVRVRKASKQSRGLWRNLADVGYGVSQALPVLIDILRTDAPQISLFQQPEVHLHPSAQAALGSWFCSIAAEKHTRGPRRQLIVETHSDYIIDRVRIGVREKTGGLRAEDVSILFFERSGLDVKIYSLRVDEQGNILDAPSNYRQFFIREVERSLGF